MEIIIFLSLLVLGYIFGQLAEKRHYKSIREREKKYLKLTTYSSHTLPKFKSEIQSDLVAGSVVISIDYFKKIAAGLRALFGGRVTAYENLLDRARREAILRMKEEALKKGASAVFNVKLETASIYKGKKNQIGSVEVLAYGTALVAKPAT